MHRAIEGVLMFEMATHELVKDIFKAKHVDLRPIGGHTAGMGVVLAMLDPGDLVIEVSLSDWGHGLVGPMCQIRQSFAIGRCR